MYVCSSVLRPLAGQIVWVALTWSFFWRNGFIRYCLNFVLCAQTRNIMTSGIPVCPIHVLFGSIWIHSCACKFVCVWIEWVVCMYGLVCFQGGCMAAGWRLRKVPSHERVRIAAVECPSPWPDGALFVDNFFCFLFSFVDGGWFCCKGWTGCEQTAEECLSQSRPVSHHLRLHTHDTTKFWWW